MTFIEDDAVPRLERQRSAGPGRAQLRIDVDDDTLQRNRGNRADAHAAVLGKAPFHELLMIDAVQEPVREPARETLRKVNLLLVRDLEWPLRDRGVDRRPVSLGRGRHVMGALQPALDLET